MTGLAVPGPSTARRVPPPLTSTASQARVQQLASASAAHLIAANDLSSSEAAILSQFYANEQVTRNLAGLTSADLPRLIPLFEHSAFAAEDAAKMPVSPLPTASFASALPLSPTTEMHNIINRLPGLVSSSSGSGIQSESLQRKLRAIEETLDKTLAEVRQAAQSLVEVQAASATES